MNIEKKRFTYFYSLFWGIWVFFQTTGNISIFENLGISYFINLNKVMIIVFSVILTFQLKMDYKSWIFFIVCWIVLIISSIQSNNSILLFYFMIVVSLINSEKEIFYKSTFFAMVLGVVFVLTLYHFGYLSNVVQYRLGKVRNSLGFSLPLVLPSLYFCLGSMYLIVFRNNSWIKKILFFLPMILITILCDGRAPFILLLSLFLSVQFLSNIKSIFVLKMIYTITIFFLIFAITISIFVAINYDSTNLLYLKLDEIFTGRFSWWHLYWNQYHFKFFGQSISRIGSYQKLINDNTSLMILDNAYLSLLIEHGLLVFIFFVYGLVRLLKYHLEKHDVTMIILWLHWIIYGVVSNQLFYMNKNILLLQIGLLFFPLIKVKKKGEVYL